MINRHSGQSPDFIFSVVRVPKDWKPESIFDIPPGGKVIFRVPVASFDEAHEDLVRSNEFALEKGIREWAMIETAGAGA
ncbi:MAG: hypothetical protein P8J27_10340 [Mariniblastus sp.]|nr:hypothetical protein [Mariniblastus sp.]